LKAEAVALALDHGLVIAADTVGWLRGKVIGKPEDEADARRIIQALAGTVHELWTGVCLWLRPGDWQLTWQEKSLVRMKALSEGEIDAYLKTRKWEGCSGAYAIELPHDPYLSVEHGSVSNVIGLPMESLEKALKWVTLMLTK
jgi:septum formation protein